MRITTTALAAGVLILLAAPAPAGAATRSVTGWTGGGVPVCTAPGDQPETWAATDGAAGLFVAWNDARPTAPGIYLQRLDAAGDVAAGWPLDGLRVCGVTPAPTLTSLIADDAGGVYLAWDDVRNGPASDVYAQHIDAAGQRVLGWPADGLAVCDTTDDQSGAGIVSDGAGGAILVWRDARDRATSAHDLYALRLAGDGARVAGWPHQGVPVSRAASDQSGIDAVTDGQGGVYVLWSDDAAGPALWAQHLDSAGAPGSAWPADGLALVTLDPGVTLQDAAMLADSGTANVVWRDDRASGAGPGFYALGVDTDGAVAPAGGQLVLATGPSTNAMIAVSDSAGGTVMVWLDFTLPATLSMKALRLRHDGVPLAGWPASGVEIAQATVLPLYFSVVADGGGGAFVTWADDRDASGPGDYDVFAQHVLGSGALATGWTLAGAAVATGPLAQLGMDITGDGGGGALVAWAQGPAGGEHDLYAAHLAADGTVPVLASVVSAEVVLGHPRIVWQLGAASASVGVERRAPGDAWVALGAVTPDGERRVRWEDADAAPGATYDYRLALRDASGAPASAGEVRVAVPIVASRLALSRIAPNPARDAVTVTLAARSDVPCTVELLDLSGRRLRSVALAAARGPAREARFERLEALPAGLYFVRVTQAGEVRLGRVALVR